MAGVPRLCAGVGAAEPGRAVVAAAVLLVAVAGSRELRRQVINLPVAGFDLGKLLDLCVQPGRLLALLGVDRSSSSVRSRSSAAARSCSCAIAPRIDA